MIILVLQLENVCPCGSKWCKCVQCLCFSCAIVSKLRLCECMEVIKESKCYMEVLIIPETVITALRIHVLKSRDLLSLKIKLQYSNILMPDWLKCLLKIYFSSFLEVYLWIFRISFWRYSNNSILWAWYSKHSSVFLFNISLLFHQRYCWVTVMGKFGSLCWPRKRDLLSPFFSLLLSESL